MTNEAAVKLDPLYEVDVPKPRSRPRPHGQRGPV